MPGLQLFGSDCVVEHSATYLQRLAICYFERSGESPQYRSTKAMGRTVKQSDEGQKLSCFNQVCKREGVIPFTLLC
jgi:hypothetical protein